MKRLAILFFMTAATLCSTAQEVDMDELVALRTEVIKTRELTKMTRLLDMYASLYQKNHERWRDSVSHWKYYLKREHLFKMKSAELEKYGMLAMKQQNIGTFCVVIAEVYEYLSAKKAIEWYKRAVYLGDEDYYMKDIARLYADGGKGMGRNDTYAIYWYYQILDAYNSYYSDLRKKAQKALDQYKKAGKINSQLISKLEAIDAEEQKLKPKSVDKNLFVSKVVADNVFAIIIANEKYKYESAVDFAGHDGDVMKQYFVKTLGIPEEQVMLRRNCSYNQMRLILTQLKKSISDSGKHNAKILFYYAGHGIPDEASRSSYLLPADGFGNDYTSGYALHQLCQELGAMTQGSVVMMLDACFSGSQRSGDMMQSSTRGVAIKVKPEAPPVNVVVLSASQEDQAAFAYKEKEHGMFTYFLLEKLKDSKGEATLNELSDYVIRQVEESAKAINKKPQTPTVYSMNKSNDWKSWKLK